MPRTVSGERTKKRVPLSIRTTEEIRERLEAAALKSGRSITQEVEIRVEKSFDFEGIAKTIADASIEHASKNMRQLMLLEEQLVQLGGGPGNMSLGLTIGTLAQNLESETGKSWREDEQTRDQLEAKLIEVIPMLLRDPPSPWREDDGQMGLADLGRSISESKN